MPPLKGMEVIENFDETTGDELLNTEQVALWLGMSADYLNLGRSRRHQYGPPFIRVSNKCVRYRRSDVIEWLKSRRVDFANKKIA
jgi:predicted DNA-binding transcriptional regulator AlpA